LGQLPLSMQIRQQADGGTPTVRAAPESQASDLYRDAARHLAARLWTKEQSAPTIRMIDD
jgi:ATP-binding protein involved in chromosome partitioning